jgi:hypothetical protein
MESENIGVVIRNWNLIKKNWPVFLAAGFVSGKMRKLEIDWSKFRTRRTT